MYLTGTEASARTSPFVARQQGPGLLVWLVKPRWPNNPSSGFAGHAFLSAGRGERLVQDGRREVVQGCRMQILQPVPTTGALQSVSCA
jgi:hypothetical protein